MTKTVKNTINCVIVLFLISVVSVSLLAVANKFLKVEVTLDAETAALINKIAPTGYDDASALSRGNIKMVNLESGEYGDVRLSSFNSEYGSANEKVLALYTSQNKDSDKITIVVEAQAAGFAGPISTLVAFDDDKRISGVVVKSQSESYWQRAQATIQDFYDSLIGKSGNLSVGSVAGLTGTTSTKNGILKGVNLACVFASRLEGADEYLSPTEVTDADTLQKLAKVSDAETFTQYGFTAPKGGIDSVFAGNNGDTVFMAVGSGSYSATLLVGVEDGKVTKLTVMSDSFDPIDGHDSAPLRDDDKLLELFGGKTLSQVSDMRGNGLAGVTGVTTSGNALINAVKAALTYAPQFDIGDWEGK